MAIEFIIKETPTGQPTMTLFNQIGNDYYLSVNTKDSYEGIAFINIPALTAGEVNVFVGGWPVTEAERKIVWFMERDPSTKKLVRQEIVFDAPTTPDGAIIPRAYSSGIKEFIVQVSINVPPGESVTVEIGAATNSAGV